ncbi:ubiquitin carboxyl-terminal hydrolase domain-containing protein [Trichoderma novae-zelandiae]
MVGAENRSAVTCYIDALLFAMFSKLDAFECMLRNDFPLDDPRNKLVTLLRIWVNMLRSGKLIHTDLTKVIQDTMAECGWSDARLLEQQDTSEAFAFLTEKLELPLLSLQVDLYHQGKQDKDDHKIVYERLLNLAVPSDPDGSGVKLEDCLEEYFNTQVDVLRDSEEAKKAEADAANPSLSPKLMIPVQIQLVRDSPAGESSTTPAVVTSSPIELSPAKPLADVLLEKDEEENGEEEAKTDGGPTVENNIPKERTSEDEAEAKQAKEEKAQDEKAKEEKAKEEENAEEEDDGNRPASEQVNGTSQNSSAGDVPQSNAAGDHSTASSSNPLRNRSASVIQRVLLDEQGRPTSSENIARRKRTSMKGSTVVRAVTIPAWQFFRLIPWHAVKSTEPQNDVEVAMNFDQRPVVGICLKRYAMTESGRPQRHNTYIDIPESMRLPHFMLADGPHIEEETNGLATEYKLVLQSVICHRGDSLQSGHYIAFARVAPKLLTGNRKHAIDPPPDYEEAQWVKFDDLEIRNRVTFVEDIKESLKVEMPYLLFYQIVPMVDPPGPSTDSTAGGPPSYDDSRSSLERMRSAVTDDTPTSSTQGLVTRHEHEASASAQALVTHLEHKASASTQALVTHHEHQPSASTGRLGQSKPPSIRLSAEVERPSRKWLEGISMNFGGSYGETAMSRRQSYAPTDSAVQSPALTPDTQSPAMAPVDEPTSSRLSRAASRFNLGKQSRPGSQSGEGRMSLNLSRFGGLIKTSKEPLPEPPALNISSANSTGQRSPQPGSPTSLEKQLQPPSGTEKHEKPDKHEKTDKVDKGEKHKHKRKKSKEKNEKQKSGDQPERECVVM